MDDDRLRAPGAPPTPPSSQPEWVSPAPPAEPPPPATGAMPPTPAGWSAPPPSRGRRVLGVAAVVLAAIVVFSAGMSVGQIGNVAAQGEPTPSYSPAAGRPDWRLLDQAYDLLDQHYVDPAALDPLSLERGAITGMTESLDDRGHTGYLTPDEVKQRDEGLSGTFVGVGAVLDQRDDRTVIVRVLRSSPAERAGLLAGDEILSVDGTDVAGQTVEDIVSKVRGPEGTDVTLELKGTDGTTRTLTITRAKLDLPLASWAFAPGTRDAVLRLESFSSGAAKALEANLRDALDQGAEGIVLDLRGNPGGYVNEPVEVASQFLADAVVYVSVDRSGTKTPHRTEGTPIAADIPLVVLVDDQTASSAEILTGALQDAGRGRVVGVTTYGTGTVVNTYSLDDGSALTVGTERWLTPKGRAIWREGLTPDEVVELPDGAALVVPDDFATLGSGGVAATDDAQLKAALNALDREQGGSRRALDRAA
jgi:carboxyl-terminal processing protease